MLINQLHQGGIRAIMAYDSTVFDNMQLPTGVDLNDVVNHILYEYGDTPLYSPDPTILKYYIKVWSKRRLPVWQKYADLLAIEFNPLENYDRTEYTTLDRDVTVDYTGTQTMDHTGDDTLTHSGTDTTAHSGTDTESHSGDDTNVKTGNIRTVADDSKVLSDSGFNSSAWTNDKKEKFDGDTTETYNSVQDKLTHGESVDFTHGESVDLTHGHTEETAYNSTQERTDNLTTTTDYYDTIDTHIHGNIGVMSSQDMFKQQIDIIPYYDIIQFIGSDWHSEFNLMIY